MLSQRINITLPEKLIRELSFSVPVGKRSLFIAEALSEKLGRKNALKKTLKTSLEINKSFYSLVAQEWKDTEIVDWPQA